MNPRILKTASVLCLLTFLAAPVFAQVDSTSTTTSTSETAPVVEATPVAVEADAEVENLSLKKEVDAISIEVKNKEKSVKDLESVITKYKDRIVQQLDAQDSLQNSLALLENRVKEKELTIEQTKAQIDLANLEARRVEAQITIVEQSLAKRRGSLGEIMLELQDAGSVGDMEAFLARPSLSEFFSRLEELNRVEGDLTDATDEVKAAKADLEAKQKEIESFRVALQEQTLALQKEQDQLEQERAAKISLLVETSQEEGQYQRILYELRQQRQEESNNIADLEAKLKDKLDSIDAALARGDILLNWPVVVAKGVSATFHDKTYPFRKMFEHPGIDMPTNVGTPVKAAAGGYVAFTRTGSQYGNYIMIVHSGGVATVYAHLSKFNVSPDTYVERGEVIGYSGGRPGDQGAGLSTGPHLHFEVRQDGIPTDPMPFLPSLE
ncbi:MAG: peptidoglycan DD-metalloendopeptidase family protein [Candidatus Uhrbacteria bacterium]